MIGLQRKSLRELGANAARRNAARLNERGTETSDLMVEWESAEPNSSSSWLSSRVVCVVLFADDDDDDESLDILDIVAALTDGT